MIVFLYNLRFIFLVAMICGTIPLSKLQAQDARPLKHHLAWNFYPRIQDIGSDQKVNQLELVYLLQISKIRMRAKLRTFREHSSFYVTHYSLDTCQQDQVRDVSLQNDFRGKRGYGLNIGLDWKTNQKRLNVFAGGELFFERIEGEIHPRKSSCQINAQGQYIGDTQILNTFQAGYNRLGLIPIVGFEFNATPRIFLLLEFGWRIFTEFGKGEIYNEDFEEIRHPIRANESSFQIARPNVNSLALGVRF